MGIDHRCRWVRHRLPLLAGGELGVEERRRVERHLIGCPGCRDRRASSASALDALRAFAGEAPAPDASPSLWPSLALQIRQSRHAAPRPAWWELPPARPWPAFGMALGLGAVIVAALALPSARRAESPAPAVSVDVAPEEAPEVLAISPSGDPSDRLARASGGPSRVGAGAFDPPQVLRLDYDLDHGTPMGPGSRDPQHSY